MNILHDFLPIIGAVVLLGGVAIYFDGRVPNFLWPGTMKKFWSALPLPKLFWPFPAKKAAKRKAAYLKLKASGG